MSGLAARARVPEPPLAAVRELHPAYFALVMATGIVSIACRLHGQPLLAAALFALNVVCYATLWTLLALRLLRHSDAVRADFASHSRAVGFFTVVAATCVLGSQCWLIAGWRRPAVALWLLGTLLWFTLTYAVFTVLTVKSAKPTLAEGLNGGWLVAVVAAQSVAVLGTQLAPGFASRTAAVLFFCLVVWLAGGMLYVWIIGLVFYRYTFFPLQPADLAPPYWINMGAVAISALAGTLLLGAAPHSPLLAGLVPFVQGLTLLYWATASGWIPMLVILGAWRHGYMRLPVRYDPLYWGAVFPLGMYAAATARLARAVGVAELAVVSRAFAVVALAAWCLTFTGLLRRLALLAVDLRGRRFGSHTGLVSPD